VRGEYREGRLRFVGQTSGQLFSICQIEPAKEAKMKLIKHQLEKSYVRKKKIKFMIFFKVVWLMADDESTTLLSENDKKKTWNKASFFENILSSNILSDHKLD
jgi:hypothetical protein